MLNIVYAFAVLAGLGVLFGGVLAVAGKVFAVEEDPRLEPLTEALPGANCGGCGFSGCSAYATAVLEGKAAPGGCPVGGEAAAKAMAEIMGVKMDVQARKVALVHCTGHGHVHQNYDYDGISDCLAASRLPGGGPLACPDGCLGFGSCVKACPFDAIHIDPENHVAVVDPDKCKACGKCIAICPRGIISLVPADPHVSILCSSKRKGVFVRQVCDIGCLGCGICEKTCPEGAITVEQFLAKIDYNKCTNCELCEEKCPRHLIR